MVDSTNRVPKHFKSEDQKRRERESRWKMTGRFLFNVVLAPLLFGFALALVAYLTRLLGIL